MSTGQQQIGTDLVQLVRDGQRLLVPVPAVSDWLTAVRERGAAAVRDTPKPERRQEDWRYTPVSFLDETRYTPQLDGPFAALQPADVEELLLPDDDTQRLVFVNGYLQPALSRFVRDPRGVVLSTLSGELDEMPPALRETFDRIAEHRHVFSALNSALMSDGALVFVPAGISAEQPIEILHLSIGMDDPGISHPRHLIVLEDGARAHVIERYCALGDAVYFNNALVEVSLGCGSELVHERLQEESARAQHMNDLHVRLQSNSHYRQVLAALGGAWSRHEVRVTFAGEGARAELDGLMLARDRQLNDVHLDVRHEVPNCTSREAFKGILDGRGRVVFDGRVLVARDAQQSDAMLSNHNLMLSRAAEVDTKPQLEIYADDVKCSHGTTVGELDADQLFYLRSRGIPAEQARQMLCRGFAEEVLDRIGHDALRERAFRLLGERLSTSLREERHAG